MHDFRRHPALRKYINYLLILFAFSLPFKFFLMNGLAVIIFALWLFEGDLRAKWRRLVRMKIFWVLGAFSLITLLSAAWSETLYGGYTNNSSTNAVSFWFAKFGYKFLIIPVLLTVVDTKLLQQIISAFLAAMFISEIVSYGIFFQLWHLPKTSPEDPTPFLHHTYYSIFLVFTIFILLVRFAREKRRSLQLFYLLFALSATANLFLNGGRTGQLAFVFAALYFVWHHYRFSYKSLLATLLALGLLYLVAYRLSPVFEQRMHYTKESLEKLRRGEMQTSFGQRVALWLAAFEVIKRDPLTGAGIGDSKTAIKAIQQKHFPDRAYMLHLRHMHNQFLQAWVDSGIVAFLLLIYLFYLFFRENFQICDPYAKVYAISLLFLFMTDTPFHFNLGVNYVIFFTALLFGCKAHLETPRLVTAEQTTDA